MYISSKKKLYKCHQLYSFPALNHLVSNLGVMRQFLIKLFKKHWIYLTPTCDRWHKHFPESGIRFVLLNMSSVPDTAIIHTPTYKSMPFPPVPYHIQSAIQLPESRDNKRRHIVYIWSGKMKTTSAGNPRGLVSPVSRWRIISCHCPRRWRVRRITNN